jgi:protein SCO1
MPRRLLHPIVFLLCLLGIGALVHTLIAIAPQKISIGGPFRLMSTSGRVMTDVDFKGRPLLLYFGYTHCPDICPTTLAHLALVLKAIGKPGHVGAAFVTVDPARDTLAMLKDYLASFDPQIIGLWGTPAEIAHVEHAFHVTALRTPEPGGGYTIDHTAMVFLMDKNGQFVGPFDVDLPPETAANLLRRYF